MTDQLADSAEKLFTAHAGKAVLGAAEQGVFPQPLWDAVVEAGFTAALLPEEAGGFGATVAEAMGLLRISAAYAAPVPLGETMLAGWLLARAGLAVPEGALSIAPVRTKDRLTLTRDGDGWTLTGTATRIPWARDAAAIAVLAEGPDGPAVALLPKGSFTVAHDRNTAHEPRDTITVEATLPAGAVALANTTAAQLRAAGAAIRTVQMAGALSRVLSITIGYVQTRVQFGRPIGKFQAIQQNMAILAGQSAAALAAADNATDALAGTLSPLLVGSAKARAGEAASIGAGLAHQAHGAIGFTQEYDLHYVTKRLWSWRDEFGNEAEWNALVGRAALEAGPDGLWPLLTAA
ncbi:acyl-CoA dehydrogenase family protein [Acidisphaera sp. L21]|uniref:acyl-CoA dehydrogenase family protein n=1 Tax=Acidisphaera sp. L21 TaxID=1641851 RepID=UPI00131E41B5|nr:acyl-CoA dehydrogenase family protein [Acidisphaera sp. L21]